MRTLNSLILILALLWSASTSAQGDATAFLKARHAEVHKLLKRKASSPAKAEERANAVTKKLAALLDYKELARRALHDHWETLTPAQQTEFTDLLSKLIERNYQQNLESTMDYRVAYKASKPRGKEVLVETLARSTKNRRAPAVAIDYRLVPQDQLWRVCDVVTDGVSLVDNYRSQFNRIIRKHKFEGLIERMEKKLAEQG